MSGRLFLTVLVVYLLSLYVTPHAQQQTRTYVENPSELSSPEVLDKVWMAYLRRLLNATFYITHLKLDLGVYWSASYTDIAKFYHKCRFDEHHSVHEPYSLLYYLCDSFVLTNRKITVNDTEFRDALNFYNLARILTKNPHVWLNLTFYKFEMDPLDDEMGECKFSHGLQVYYDNGGWRPQETLCGTLPTFSIIIPASRIMIFDTKDYRDHKFYYIHLVYSIITPNNQSIGNLYSMVERLPPKANLMQSFSWNITIMKRIWKVVGMIGYKMKLKPIRCSVPSLYICNGPRKIRCQYLSPCTTQKMIDISYFISYIEIEISEDDSPYFRMSYVMLPNDYQAELTATPGQPSTFAVNSSGIPIFHRSWAISTGLTPLEILVTTNNTFGGYTGENCIFGGNYTICFIFINTVLQYSIFTLSPDLSRFKSTNNKSQLYYTDTHVQVLIAFND